VLHDEEGLAVLLDDVEDRGTNGCTIADGRFRLTQEPRAHAGVADEVGSDRLDGDRAVEAPVASEVDLAHSPRTDPLQEFVRPYETADVTAGWLSRSGTPRDPS
jgi:hypothetical protein